MNILVNGKLRMISLKHIESFRLDERAKTILREKVKQTEISVKKLSELTDGAISYGYMNKIVYGQIDVISVEKLMCLLDILNIDLEEIFDSSVAYVSSR